MNLINRFLSVPYVERGRSMSGLDCWGLVVLVKRELFNEELPSFGAAIRGASMQEALERELPNHSDSNFKDGAIACVFKDVCGKMCFFHVGIVVGGKVLHTRERKGASLDKRASFERLGIVKYYD